MTTKKKKKNRLFKTRPYAHQLECWEESRDREYYAYLLEQGLGKTKIALDVAGYLTMRREIDGLLVVAPNGVHSNWVRRELPKHLSDSVRRSALEWYPKKHATRWWGRAFEKMMDEGGLAVFAVNVEALSKKRSTAMDYVEMFLSNRQAMIVVDESSRIKNPRATRTKNVIKLGKLAPYRRIATGTPVTQTPFDIFSQYGFLDPSILGFRSFHAFRHQYGVFDRKIAVRDGKQWRYETLVEYVRLDDLAKRIDPHSYRRTKEECLDIPPKIYQQIPVTMTTKQRRYYDEILREGVIEVPDEGFDVIAPLQITRMMRAQQIIGGFLPTNDPESTKSNMRPIPPGGNPKLEALVDLVENDYVGKTIVWARFRHEINAIASALRSKFGRQAVVEFHGGVDADARGDAIDRFQNDDVRFLIGQQQSGIGVTLTAAEFVFYFSNSFSVEQRIQTEDRCHRIGTRHSVVYVDLEMEDTIDGRIREVLSDAVENAEAILGDERRRSG